MNVVGNTVSNISNLSLCKKRRPSGAGDYVEITTTDGRRFLHSERLDILETVLPTTFIRTHRSHIVNMVYVSQLLVTEHSQNVLVTCKQEHVPISRRRLQGVKSRLLNVMDTP